MKTTPWLRTVALLTTLCLTLASCTSLQGVTLPSPARPNDLPKIETGERVIAKMRDGTVHDFNVTAVEADALVGQNVRAPYAEMASLNVNRFDGARTGIFFGVIGGIVVIAVALSGATI